VERRQLEGQADRGLRAAGDCSHTGSPTYRKKGRTMRRQFFALLSVVAAILLAAGSGSLARGSNSGDKEGHDDFESGSALVVPSNDSSASNGAAGKKGPQVGPNVRVNAAQVLPGAGLLGRSETTIAADATGLDLVAGFNDAQGFCGRPFGAACTPQSPSGLSGYAFSTDGGATWTDGNAPPNFNNVFTRGDPWMARGGLDGNTFFYANLAVDATTGADLGVSVHRGHFNGSSFAWEDVHVFNAPNAPNDFYDKEAIAVDKQDQGLGIVSLTNFVKACGVPQNGDGQIEVWRTADGGTTWHGPTIVSPDQTNPACDGTGTLQQSSAPAITPKGDAYVAWQFGPTFTATGTSTNAEIRLAHSSDGGATFGTPVTVAAINSMRQDPPVGYTRDRINDHPRVAVATSGPHKGRVFVSFYSAVAPVTAAALTPCPPPNVGATCRAQNLTSSQVFVTFSDDKGQTWSTPTPLAPAPPPTGIKRLWPVVTVGNSDNVDVVYNESQETATGTTSDCNVSLGGGRRRRGPAHSFVNTFMVHSSDGGATFGSPVQVSSATSDWCTAQVNIRPNFGDYIGSAAEEGTVFPVWGDSRNGPVDTFFAPVALDN